MQHDIFCNKIVPAKHMRLYQSLPIDNNRHLLHSDILRRRGSSFIGIKFKWNRLSASASRWYSFRPLRLRVTRSSLPTLSSSTRVTGSSWKKARIHGLSIFVDKAEAIVVSIHSPSLFTPPFRHAHTNSETRFRNAKSRMGETCRKDQKCCKGCLLGHNQFWPNSAYRWADSGHSYH